MILFSNFAIAAAPQSLGELELSRLLIEPSFFVMEPKTSSFEMSKAMLGAVWRNDNRWSAHLTFGSSSMIGVPKRYGTLNQELSLLEAFGQWDSGVGVWRIGMIPLDFGLQGGSSEENIMVSARAVISKRLFGAA